MSKLSALSILAALVLAPALAQSQALSCTTGTRVTGGTPASPSFGNGGNFTNFITGAQICASRSGDRWQEFHQGGGALFDYKRGPANTVDPTTQVGNWTASNGASTVTHTYGASSYTWAVCHTGGNSYTLVSATGGTISGATITTTAGPTPCP